MGNLPELELLGITPFVATPGVQLVVTGKNIRSTLTLTSFSLVGSVPILEVVDGETVRFVMEADAAPFGRLNLAFEQDGVTRTLPLFFNADGREDHPILTLEPSLVCAGKKFYAADGALKEGARLCSPTAIPNCSVDAQKSCRAVASFPAANIAGAEAKIAVGVSAAGVTGSLALAPPDCGVDGEQDCVVATGFAAALTSGLAAKVASTETVAGVAGAVVVPGAPVVLQGANYGPQGTSLMGSLKVPPAGMVNVANGAFGVAGSGTTPTLGPCDEDGDVDCLTSAGFPAAKFANFTDADIAAGATIAGVDGTMTVTPPTCTSDGELGCLTDASYPSAATAGLPAKVLTGQTVAGASGTATLPSVSSVFTGTTFGVAGALAGTLTLPAAGNVLTSNGPFGVGGASVTPTYVPDFPAVANVLAPNTVNGVSGTLTLPAPSNVLSGSGAYGVGGSGSTPSFTPDFPAVVNVLGPDTVDTVTGTLTLPAASNVRTVNGAYGVGGTGTNPSLANCASDGGTTCVATASYPAAEVGASHLTVGNVKAGVTIGGVTGQYPSAAHRLASNSATVDLTSFITQMTTNAGFEFFDSEGNVYSGSGDADIAAANVKNLVQFENLSITGTYVASLSGTDAKHIRYGVSLGGVSGTLKTNCRNAVRSAVYNSDGLPGNTGVTSGTALDVWDTIDDYGNATGPTALPWSAAYYCDGSQMTDETSNLSLTPVNAAIHGGDTQWNKIFYDSYSGLYMTNTLDTASAWAAAVSLCDNLNNGNQGGAAAGNTWRLATQKELMQLLINGIMFKDATFYGTTLFTTLFWTATTESMSTTDALRMNGFAGVSTSNANKANDRAVICVR